MPHARQEVDCALVVDGVIKRRFANRRFTDRPVSQRMIEDILEVARFAPSGANIQPWHVYVLAGAEKEEFDPPSAQRVVARAMVLAMLDFRAEMEQWPRAKTDRGLHACLTEAVDRLDLSSEMEPTERDFVRSPLGRAHEAVSVASSWRVEGLAVLAWSLKRFELPPHDTMVPPLAVRAGSGTRGSWRAFPSASSSRAPPPRSSSRTAPPSRSWAAMPRTSSASPPWAAARWRWIPRSSRAWAR